MQTVTVTQLYPTRASANQARDGLARDGGFTRYGIERIAIERAGAAFELRISTVESHRDQIEHLLRSSGTMLNPPASEPPWVRTELTRSLLLFGAAAAAGALLFRLLARRPGTTDRQRWGREAWRGARPPARRGGDNSRTWQREAAERSARRPAIARRGFRGLEEGRALSGLGRVRDGDGRPLPGSRVEHDKGHTDLRRNRTLNQIAADIGTGSRS